MKKSRNVDLKAIAGMAMEKYGFLPRFPDPVLQEVDAITDKVQSHGGGRDQRPAFFPLVIY